MTESCGSSQSTLSVVVVTLNDIELTAACLDGLAKQELLPLEVIVVDNGSEHDVIGPLRSAFPDVLYESLESNRGFAGGYNYGLLRARGDLVAIINNDAIPLPGWTRALVDAAEQDPTVGAVASVVLDGGDPELLDSMGLGLAVDGMARQLHRGEAVAATPAPERVLLPSGSACLFRRTALADVGVFDDTFFAYCEDADLGLRLTWAGWRTVLAADAKVIHKYSATTGRYSSKKVFLVERNHLWLAVKNLPAPFLCALPFTTLWRYWLQLRAVREQSGDLHMFVRQTCPMRLALTLIAAHASFAVGLPTALRQRRAIAGRRRVGTREMTALLWRHRLSMVAVLSAEVSPSPPDDNGTA